MTPGTASASDPAKLRAAWNPAWDARATEPRDAEGAPPAANSEPAAPGPEPDRHSAWRAVPRDWPWRGPAPSPKPGQAGQAASPPAAAIPLVFRPKAAGVPAWSGLKPKPAGAEPGEEPLGRPITSRASTQACEPSARWTPPGARSGFCQPSPGPA